MAPVFPDTRLYLLGVDGGGTGTRALLAAADGTVLAQGHGPASGLALGAVPAWRAIGSACAMAFEALGERLEWSRCVLACGLAGENHEDLRAAFLAIAPPVRSLTLVSDARTALLGAHGAAHGAVVALGTGSVGAAWLPDGAWRMVGGFGFPAGDEASGAWLGLQAVRHTQRVLDGRTPDDALSDAVCVVVRAAAGGGADAPADATGGAKCAVTAVTAASAGALANTDRDRLVAAFIVWLGDASQARYAALAPLLFDHREVPSAARILGLAGTEIAAMMDALDPGGALPIALCGGLAQPLFPYVPAAWRGRLVAPRGSSAHGALHLAAQALAEARDGSSP